MSDQLHLVQGGVYHPSSHFEQTQTVIRQTRLLISDVDIKTYVLTYAFTVLSINEISSQQQWLAEPPVYTVILLIILVLVL